MSKKLHNIKFLDIFVGSIWTISIIKRASAAALWLDHGQTQVLAPSILPGHTKAEKTQAFGQYQHHPRDQHQYIYIILGMVIINIARVDIKLPRQLKTASEKHVAAQIFSMAEVVVF